MKPPFKNTICSFLLSITVLIIGLLSLNSCNSSETEAKPGILPAPDEYRLIMEGYIDIESGDSINTFFLL